MAEMTTDQVAVEVAEALGDGWKAASGHWENGTDAHIVGPDDETLHMARDRYGSVGKWEIGGTLPDGWFDHAPREFEREKAQRPNAIKCAIAKTPAQIAGEITRRYLPKWRPYLDATRQRKAQNDAWHASITTVGETFLAALADERSGWDERDNRHTNRPTPPTKITVGRYGDRFSGTASVGSGGDGFTFTDLRMSAVDAVAFAQWMAKRRKA